MFYCPRHSRTEEVAQEEKGDASPVLSPKPTETALTVIFRERELRWRKYESRGKPTTISSLRPLRLSSIMAAPPTELGTFLHCFPLLQLKPCKFLPFFVFGPLSEGRVWVWDLLYQECLYLFWFPFLCFSKEFCKCTCLSCLVCIDSPAGSLNFYFYPVSLY